MWHLLELDLLLSAIAWKCIGSIPLCKLNIHGWVIETPRKDSFRIYICSRQPPINLVKCGLSLTFDHRNLIVFLTNYSGLGRTRISKRFMKCQIVVLPCKWTHSSTWKLSSNLSNNNCSFFALFPFFASLNESNENWKRNHVLDERNFDLKTKKKKTFRKFRESGFGRAMKDTCPVVLIVHNRCCLMQNATSQNSIACR